MQVLVESETGSFQGGETEAVGFHEVLRCLVNWFVETGSSVP